MSNKQNKQPNPYRVDRLAGIPSPVKAIFIKWWFAGAVFFFIGMGLPALHSTDNLDLVFALGIVLGMVNDLLVNNLFRYMRTDRAIYDPWMVFPKKGLLSFFANVLYYILVSFGVYFLYTAINTLAVKTGIREASEIFLAVEPVGYGIATLLIDLIVLGIKALIKKLFVQKQQ